jgi:hypothetical protein
MFAFAKELAIMGVCTLIATSAAVRSARDVRDESARVTVDDEMPVRLIVDPPLPGPLSEGRVYIPYRTENLRGVPVSGKAAPDPSPRVGHVYVTVDDAPWHFADSGGETIVVVGLPPGSHKMLIELADTSHKVISSETVTFTLPVPKRS